MSPDNELNPAHLKKRAGRNDHELTPDECLRFGLVDELFTPLLRTPTAKDADTPRAETTQAMGETETEAEKLFMDMARAFGVLLVRDFKKFHRKFWDWSVKNVREET